jgi:TPR repeat protein
MGVAITPVVFAVRGAAGWVTWRDAGEWDLFRLACASFAAVVDAIPDRQTLGSEERPDVVVSLYARLDQNESALLWAMAMTHPGRDLEALGGLLMGAAGETEGPILPWQVCWADVESLASARAARGDELLAAGRTADAVAAWMVAAEAGGSTLAMHRLGAIAHASERPGLAAEWWLRGARAGDVDCMTSLGAVLADTGDVAGAEAWDERAAGKGSVAAMFNRGVLAYRLGKVPVARYWFEKAAAHGDADATQALQRLPRR